MTTNASEFANLGLAEDLLEAVARANFTTPTPVQSAAIPVALTGADVICKARTGTGKTAAFALPALSTLTPLSGKARGAVEVLVITPTRELALQVCAEIERLGTSRHPETVPVFGGTSAHRQIELLNKNARIAVATPGRLLDLIQGGKLRRFEPRIIVLDEADEMLKMGFIEDIRAILSHIETIVPQRQTMLFSATMPPEIKRLADRMLTNPVLVDVATGETHAPDIEQFAVVIKEGWRLEAARRIVEFETPEKAIVFCKTKAESDELSQLLGKSIPQVAALHGDMPQSARTQVMQKFRTGRIRILVATDVAARGLDVQGVSHVINFHMPWDTEGYVHRIGRTGRAGKPGKSYILASPSELNGLNRLEKDLRMPLQFAEVPTLKMLRAARLGARIQILSQLTPDQSAIESVRVMLDQMGLTGEELAARLLTAEMSTGTQADGDFTDNVPDSVSYSKEELGKAKREARRNFFTGDRRRDDQRRAPKGRRPEFRQSNRRDFGGNSSRKFDRDRPRDGFKSRRLPRQGGSDSAHAH